jgi:hypothetical protein
MFFAVALASAAPAMAEDININDNSNVTVRAAPPDLCIGKGPAHEACEEYFAEYGLQQMRDALPNVNSGPLKMARGPAPEAPRCKPGQWLTIDGCQAPAPLPAIKHEQAVPVISHAISLCPNGRMTRDGCW